MKINTKAETLDPHNLADVMRDWSGPMSKSNLSPLLVMIAEILDDSVQGGDSFVTFGCNKNRDAVIATVVYRGTREYLAGSTLEGLGVDSLRLVDLPLSPK